MLSYTEVCNIVNRWHIQMRATRLRNLVLLVSVPHELVKEEVLLRTTQPIFEISHFHQPVAPIGDLVRAPAPP